MNPDDLPEDDDRTVIRPARSGAMGHTLPVGTRLEDLEITGLIGEGGFGIVYLAWDHSLERQVAIKEYMPSTLASREAGTWRVSVKSERHRDTFTAGLKSFVNEARLLARFDHPALVKVFRFWEANRTAYMAMPYYQGPTLKAALVELGHPPDEEQLRNWLRPLLDALAVMHREQCYHRDIAPDNILLTDRGPLLLDFGAARRVIGDMTHALTVVLKPGYAPIEQYGQAAAMVQGPWTDLYALASVVHYAITGHAPNSSVERIMEDALQPLALRAAGRYGDAFLRAIDTALAVRPKDRPQDVAQFRELLDAGLPADSPQRLLRDSGFRHSSGFPPSGFAPSGFDAAPVDTTRPTTVAPVPTTLAPEPATLAEPTTRAQPLPVPPARSLPPVPPVAAPAAASRRRATLWLAALAVLAVGGTAGVLLRRAGTKGEATAEAPAALVPKPIDDAPPAAPAPAPAPVPAPAPAPAVLVEPPPAAPLVEPPPAAPLVEPPPAAPPPAPPPVAAPKRVEPAPPPPSPSPPPAPPPPPVRAPAPAPAPKVARPAVPAEVEPAPRKSRVLSPRCSDILQKASLESLTPEEADYLKRECR